MKKFFALILLVVVAILGVMLYKDRLDEKYFPGSDNTSVAEETSIAVHTETAAPVETVTATEPQAENEGAPQTEKDSEEPTPPAKTSGDVNSLLETLKIDFPANAVAVIINDPDAETLRIAGSYAVFHSSNEEPPSLIIPIYIGSTLSVNEVSGVLDDGELVYGDRLLTDPDIEDNYSILFEAIRAETLPQFAVFLEFGEFAAIYPYVYNGRDGNIGIEYIFAVDNSEPVG